MAKELGKDITPTMLNKIATNIYLSKHCEERLKQRSDLYADKNLARTLWNINYAICHCQYAYNNDDGTISIILQDGLTFICGYSDERKRWVLITIKDRSDNNVSNWEKREMAQLHTKDRNKWRNENGFDKEKRFKETNREKVKYKRTNAWKGEEW